MMLDADVVAVSPSSVYRVLRDSGLLNAHNSKPSLKGKGFQQPLRVHEHWHVDVSYINVAGTFFYLCSLLDGCSRYLVHWEIRASMTEPEIETIIQRARERYPDARPRIISDNGPQFIAKDFKEFIRICGMTHVRTSPYYPQSNGKIERWHKTLKGECIRVKTPLSLEDARRIVADFVAHYNEVRLHSAIGYVAPAAKLAGRERAIFDERDRKLDAARERRKADERPAGRPCEGVVQVIVQAVPQHYDEGRPGRRIGRRGDTTRAPTQGPRPKEGGTMPPCLSLRDWHEGDKSRQSDQPYSTLSPDIGFSISR
jgi:transposase-like protein